MKTKAPCVTGKKLFHGRVTPGKKPGFALVCIVLTMLFSTTCLEPTGRLAVPVSDLDEGLTVTVLPALTGYQQGYPFEADGIEVVLNDGGWVRNVTQGIRFSWYGGGLLNDGTDTAVTSQPGTWEITVSYDYAGRNFRTSFMIDVFTNHFIVTDGASWAAAVNHIDTHGEDRSFFITVRGNVQIPAVNSATIPNRADGLTVTLQTVRGEEARLFPDPAGSTGSLLYVAAGQTFIIDGAGLTLAGNPSNDKALVFVDGSGARLELKNGKVTGNTNRSAKGSSGIGYDDLEGNGGGVRVDGGYFVMSDGEVSGNTADFGGGVYVNGGRFDMTGGKVSGNESTTILMSGGGNHGGGGVMVNGDGTFTMSGRSSVSGNVAKGAGGGVMIAKGTLTMLDESRISGNESVNVGGGVFLGVSAGTVVPAYLNMRGGVIGGNRAWQGAGIYLYYNHGLQVQDGTVYGSDGPADLANMASDEGAAIITFGSISPGKYGTFDSADVFTQTTPGGEFDRTVEDTVRVVNGYRK